MAEYPTVNAVPNVVQEGDLWTNLATSGTIPERYLDRGMDNLGKAAFITRGTTKFLSMLTQMFPKSKTVTGREFRVHEIQELDRILFITGVSSTDTSKFSVSSKHGVQVQENDVLYNRSVYVNCESTNPTYSRTFGKQGGTYFIDNEPMMVVGVQRNTNTDGLAEAGTDTVTVRRCIRGKGRNDFGGALIPLSTITGDGLLMVGDALLRGLPSFPEGSDAPRGFFAVPYMDNNFTQEFKYAVEITKEQEIEKTYIGQKPLEIYKLLKMRQSTLDIERYFFMGQKGKAMDGLGRVQYFTGGMIEYMLRDDKHFLDYLDITGSSQLKYEGFLDLCNIIAANGGSTTKYMYTGITAYTELKKALFKEDHLRYDKEATARFDIPIEYIVGAGLEIKIIPLYTMEEMGWSNKGLVLDHEYPSFVPVSHPDWDMKIETDIQEKGQQIYKEQWIGMKGLERRYAQYQHIIDFTGSIAPGHII